MLLSRRSLLLGAAAAVAAPPRRIGLALYTVRDLVESKPFETLRAARDLGYTEVEILRRQIAPLAPVLKRLGMKAISVHFETPLITGNQEAWKAAEMPPIEEGATFDRTLDQAREHGLRYVVFNYLPPKERGDLDYYRWLADKLNAASEKARAAGLGFCYHNHNFEFQQKPGGRPIDTLLERLDERIRLEVDAFWVSMAGENAAAFIRANKGRVAMVHLKDRARGAARAFDIASVPLGTFREVGAGDLDFPAILRASAEAGVEHYFVEQDHTPDPLRSIRESYAALRRLGL